MLLIFYKRMKVRRKIRKLVIFRIRFGCSYLGRGRECEGGWYCSLLMRLL